MKFKLIESKLNEKWYDVEDWDGVKIWWSDSPYEFKNFIQNLASNQNKKQGYRLIVGKDTYAVANAMDLIHDVMDDILENQLYVPVGNEMYTLGIPTSKDYDINNFEMTEGAWSDYQDYCAGKDSTIDLWIDDFKVNKPPKNLTFEQFLDYMKEHKDSRWNNYTHTAVFEGFEVDYYGPQEKSEATFKQTELYKALKPLYIRYIGSK